MSGSFVRWSAAASNMPEAVVDSLHQMLILHQCLWRTFGDLVWQRNATSN